MTARSSAFYSHFPLGKTSVYAEPAKSVGVVTAFTVGEERGDRRGGHPQVARRGAPRGRVSAPTPRSPQRRDGSTGAASSTRRCSRGAGRTAISGSPDLVD